MSGCKIQIILNFKGLLYDLSKTKNEFYLEIVVHNKQANDWQSPHLLYMQYQFITVIYVSLNSL